MEAWQGAGGPPPADYWTPDADRAGIVHAVDGGEPVVLCMQGRKVVMQVQVDRAAGFSCKARFFNVDPDLPGWRLHLANQA